MELNDFLRTQDTIFEMLEARGYIVDEEKLTEIDDKDILMVFKNKKKESILIIWHIRSDVCVEDMKECHRQLRENNVRNAIIIKTGKLTPAANNINDISIDYKIQIFDIEELKINITKHNFVPKHELLSLSQQKELLESYKVEKKQLPKISYNDPIVKFYGWKRGSIVRIIRKNGEIYYRSII